MASGPEAPQPARRARSRCLCAEAEHGRSMSVMPFASVIGHAPVVALLRQAVARGRVPQSLLFAGPEGVGKHTVAIASRRPSTVRSAATSSGDDACGTCPTCQRIARGQHSDVVVVDRGDDAIDQIEGAARARARRRRLPAVRGRAARVHHRRRRSARRRRRTRCSRRSRSRRRRPILILVSAYPDTLLADRAVAMPAAALRSAQRARRRARARGARGRRPRGGRARWRPSSGGSVARALAETDRRSRRRSRRRARRAGRGARAAWPSS